MEQVSKTRQQDGYAILLTSPSIRLTHKTSTCSVCRYNVQSFLALVKMCACRGNAVRTDVHQNTDNDLIAFRVSMGRALQARLQLRAVARTAKLVTALHELVTALHEFVTALH